MHVCVRVNTVRSAHALHTRANIDAVFMLYFVCVHLVWQIVRVLGYF